MHSIDKTQEGRWIRGLIACAALGGAMVIGACSSSDTTPQQTGGAGGTGASAGSGGVAGTGGAAGSDAAAGSGGSVAGSGGSAGDAASEKPLDDAATTCEPQSIAGWTPTDHPPTGLYQGKCGAGEVKAVLDACVGNTATQAACTAAQSAHAACSGCLFSKDTDASWGPIIRYTKLGFYDRNAGGCFGLLQGDVSSTGCGAKINAAFDCALASCGAVCPVKTDADFTALNQCFSGAFSDPDICKPSLDTHNQCWKDGQAEDGGAKYQPCIWDSKKEPWSAVAERIGEIFCGMGPGDAAVE